METLLSDLPEASLVRGQNIDTVNNSVLKEHSTTRLVVQAGVWKSQNTDKDRAPTSQCQHCSALGKQCHRLSICLIQIKYYLGSFR